MNSCADGGRALNVALSAADQRAVGSGAVAAAAGFSVVSGGVTSALAAAGSFATASLGSLGDFTAPSSASPSLGRNLPSGPRERSPEASAGSLAAFGSLGSAATFSTAGVSATSAAAAIIDRRSSEGVSSPISSLFATIFPHILLTGTLSGWDGRDRTSDNRVNSAELYR